MEIDNLIVIEKVWHTTNDGVIGIIKCRDNITNQIKVYVGIGGGSDEKADIEKIVKFGSPVYKRELELLMRDIEYER